jgi:hypothetical protein
LTCDATKAFASAQIRVHEWVLSLAAGQFPLLVTPEAGIAKHEATAMSDEPIVLDQHRGMAAQKATEIRRRLVEVKADQAALRERQGELERVLAAAPAQTWLEAAEKARYLIDLFAATAQGQDPRRRRLIESVIDDFKRLSEATPQPVDRG